MLYHGFLNKLGYVKKGISLFCDKKASSINADLFSNYTYSLKTCPIDLIKGLYCAAVIVSDLRPETVTFMLKSPYSSRVLVSAASPAPVTEHTSSLSRETLLRF